APVAREASRTQTPSRAARGNTHGERRGGKSSRHAAANPHTGLQQLKDTVAQTIQAQTPASNPVLPPRNVSDAMRTLWIGVMVLMIASVIAKIFTAWADWMAARTTNRMEESFILRVFRHVLRLPYSFFVRQPSGAIARQIDQSDQVAPLFTAITQDVWS